MFGEIHSKLRGHYRWREGRESPACSGEHNVRSEARNTSEVCSLCHDNGKHWRSSEKFGKGFKDALNQGDRCIKMMRTHSLAPGSLSPLGRDRYINKSLQDNLFSFKYNAHKGPRGPEEEATGTVWEKKETLCGGDNWARWQMSGWQPVLAEGVAPRADQEKHLNSLPNIKLSQRLLWSLHFNPQEFVSSSYR